MLDRLQSAGQKHVEVKAVLDHLAKHGPDVRFEAGDFPSAVTHIDPREWILSKLDTDHTKWPAAWPASWFNAKYDEEFDRRFAEQLPIVEAERQKFHTLPVKHHFQAAVDSGDWTGSYDEWLDAQFGLNSPLMSPLVSNEDMQSHFGVSPGEAMPIYFPENRARSRALEIVSSSMKNWFPEGGVRSFKMPTAGGNDLEFVHFPEHGTFDANSGSKNVATGRNLSDVVDQAVAYYKEAYSSRDLRHIFGTRDADGPDSYDVGDPGGSKYFEHTQPGGSNYRMFQLRIANPKGEQFDGQHTGLSDNTFAHIRTKDRNTVDPATGKTHKILYVEEIQSDLHQQGAERGYRGDPKFGQRQVAKTQEATVDTLVKSALHRWEQNFIKSGRAPSHAETSEMFEQVYPKTVAAVERAFAAARTSDGTRGARVGIAETLFNDIGLPHKNSAMEDTGSFSDTVHSLSATPDIFDGGTPDFPFRKDWEEKAIQAITRYAAEHGYDGIAISPSTDQIERFGTTEAAIWNRAPDGGIYTRTVGHPEGYDHLRSMAGYTNFLKAVAPDYISGLHDTPDNVNYLGRSPEEAAYRLRAAHNPSLARAVSQDPNAEWGVWSNRNPGFEAAYDVRFPSTLSKIGKQHGVEVIPTIPEGLMKAPDVNDLAALHSHGAKSRGDAAAFATAHESVRDKIGELLFRQSWGANPEIDQYIEQHASELPANFLRELEYLRRLGPEAKLGSSELAAVDAFRAMVEALPGTLTLATPDWDTYLKGPPKGKVEPRYYDRTAPTLLFTPEMRQKLISEGFKLSDSAATGDLLVELNDMTPMGIQDGTDMAPAPLDTTKRSYGGKIVDYDPPMSPVPGRSAPTFRSPMASNIKTKARGAARMPIQDARSIIDKGPGARKDEVEFSGIHSMLDGMEAAGHKHVEVQALLDHLAQHGPDVRLEHAGVAGGGSANIHNWLRDNMPNEHDWEYDEDDGFQYEEDHRYHRNEFSRKLGDVRTDYLALPLTQQYLDDLKQSYDKSQNASLFDDMPSPRYDGPSGYFQDSQAYRDMTPAEVESAIAHFDEDDKDFWPSEILDHYEEWLNDKLGESGSERAAFDRALDIRANLPAHIRSAPDARNHTDHIHPAAWDLPRSSEDHPFVHRDDIDDRANSMADSEMEDWVNPYLGQSASIRLENGDAIYLQKDSDGAYSATNDSGRQIASGNYSISQLIDEIADHYNEDYDDDELIDMFGSSAAPDDDHSGQPDLAYQVSAPRANAPYDDYTEPGGTNYQAFQLRLANPSEESNLQHRGFLNNTFAHVRTKDRNTVDPATGKTHKILYVEEIQSDLHQKGTENGYRGDVKYAEYVEKKRKKDLVDSLLRGMAKHRAERGLFPANPSADDLSDFFEESYPKVAAAADRIVAAKGGSYDDAASVIDQELDALGLPAYGTSSSNSERSRHFSDAYRTGVNPYYYRGEGTTPDFPFRKDWEEKAIQAITRYAAEHGYDGVAISPSTDHIERFGTQNAKIWSRHPATGQVTVHDVPTSVLPAETVRRSGITPYLHAIAPDYISGAVAAYEHLNGPESVGRTPEEIEHRLPNNASLARSINQNPGASYGVWSERNPGFESAYDVRFPSTLSKIGKQHGVEVISTEPEGLSRQYNPSHLAELHSGFVANVNKRARAKKYNAQLHFYIRNLASTAEGQELLSREDESIGQPVGTLRGKIVDFSQRLGAGGLGAYPFGEADKAAMDTIYRVIADNPSLADPYGEYESPLPHYEEFSEVNPKYSAQLPTAHNLPTTPKRAPTLLFTPEMREKLISEGFKLSDEAAGGTVRIGNCNKYAVTLNGRPILQPTGRLELAERCMEAITLSETPANELLDMAVRGIGAKRPYWQFLSSRPSAGVAMLHETIKPEFKEVLSGGGDKFHFVDKMLRERAANGGASHPGRFHPGRTGLTGVLGVERVA
jgi:hypothetical protein